MAVVQSYYGIAPNREALALPVMLGAFFDEREGMNRALMAQRLKAAGVDDAKLAEIEAGLRRQAAELEKAKVEAEAGNFQALKKVDEKWIWSATTLQVAASGNATKASIATVEAQERVRSGLLKIANENRRRLAYDEERDRQTDAAIKSFTGGGRSSTDPDAMNALFSQLDTQRSQIDGTGAKDKLIDNKVEQLRAKGQGDLADAIAQHYMNTTDNRGYMIQKEGDYTPEEADAIVNSVGAGAGGIDPNLMKTAIDRALNAGDETVGFGYSGTVPTDEEGEPSEGVSRGTSAPTGGVSSVRAKGSPGAVGTVLAAGMDPNATVESIAAAIQGLTDQADRVRAQRENARSAPMFSGANYLLDNPNWIGRSGEDVRLLERVGKRDRVRGDEFATEPGTNREAFRAQDERGFDVEDYDPTDVDRVAMSKGGEASVYRFIADVLDDKDRDAQLAKLPARVQEIAKPYVEMHKIDAAKAKGELEKLASDDPVTLRELDMDEIAAASKDLSKFEALVTRMEGVDTDYAKAVRRTADRAKELGPEVTRARLAKIAAAGREGVPAEKTWKTPADPKVERERAATEKAAKESAERAASDDAAYQKGKALAMDTFQTWNVEGISPDEMRDRIGLMPDDAPITKGLREGLTALHASSTRKVDASDLGAKIPKPNPKDAAEYQKRKGEVSDPSNVAPWDEKAAPEKAKAAVEEDEFEDEDLAEVL